MEVTLYLFIEFLRSELVNFLADYLGLAEIKFLPFRTNVSNFYRTHTSFTAYRLPRSRKVVKKRRYCGRPLRPAVTAGLLFLGITGTPEDGSVTSQFYIDPPLPNENFYPGRGSN